PERAGGICRSSPRCREGCGRSTGMPKKTRGPASSRLATCGAPAYSTAGRLLVRTKTPRSDAPESEREMPTDIVSIESSSLGSSSLGSKSLGSKSFGGKSLGGNGMAPTTGPLGTGTLAFEPGFTLDSQYTGETPQFAEGSQFGVYIVGPCIGEGGMARV